METYSLYNNTVTLEFHEGKHMYKVNDKIVFGVTSICGILDKKALMYWAVNMAIKHLDSVLKPGMIIDEINKTKMLNEAKVAHRNTLSQAADIGTAVHNYLETYLKAGINKQPLPDLPINKDIRKGVEALLKWVKDNNVKFLDSERKIYSKEFGYAGTLDASATINGELAIIDFKTSKGFYPEYFLQVSAYCKALEEETGNKYKKVYILRIPKDGSEFAFVETNNIDLYFKSFLGCLENYKRIIWEKGEKIKESKIKLGEIR